MSEDVRAHWRLDEHDKRLTEGAKTFERLHKMEARTGYMVAAAAMAAIVTVAGGAWWTSQRSSVIEATGRGLRETRQDVADLRRELAQAARTLDRTAQAVEFLGERAKAQDAELTRLRDKAKR